MESGGRGLIVARMDSRSHLHTRQGQIAEAEKLVGNLADSADQSVDEIGYLKKIALANHYSDGQYG